MLTSAIGALTLVGMNTGTPKVFWRGEEVLGVTGIAAKAHSDGHSVHLHVTGTQEAIYAEMLANGITIKRGRP
jgi:predicted DNA-binding protein with PD1-like motif